VFITRASRHDKADISRFLEDNDWTVEDVNLGVFFFARSGPVVGCIRFVEVEPQTVVVQDMVVAPDRRGQGLGAELMRAAMNSRGGTLYLRCVEDQAGYYERFGFRSMPFEELPDSVRAHFTGDLPGPTAYLTAR
jgi:predicted N-acetyltransferase YhbS